MAAAAVAGAACGGRRSVWLTSMSSRCSLEVSAHHARAESAMPGGGRAPAARSCARPVRKTETCQACTLPWLGPGLEPGLGPGLGLGQGLGLGLGLRLALGLGLAVGCLMRQRGQ